MRAQPLRLRLSFDGSFGLEDALRRHERSGDVDEALESVCTDIYPLSA